MGYSAASGRVAAIVLAGFVLAGLTVGAIAAATAADVPVAPKSSAAKSAMRKHDGAVAQARTEFDRKVNAAGETFAKEMEAALKEATRQGDLDEALAIKATATKVRDERGKAITPQKLAVEGRWLFRFTNGVTRTYEFRPDGVVSWLEAEEGRSTPGKLERRDDGAILLSFPKVDDLERLTIADGRILLEHYHPPTEYPGPAKLMAVGTPLETRTEPKRSSGK